MRPFDTTDHTYMTFNSACNSGDEEAALSCLSGMRDRERNMYSMKTAVYFKFSSLLKAMLLGANLLPDMTTPRRRATFPLPKNKTYFFNSFLIIAINQNDIKTARLLAETVCLQKNLTEALARAARAQKREMVDVFWEKADAPKALLMLQDKRSSLFDVAGAALLKERIQVIDDHKILTESLRGQKTKAVPRKM